MLAAGAKTGKAVVVSSVPPRGPFKVLVCASAHHVDTLMASFETLRAEVLGAENHADALTALGIFDADAIVLWPESSSDLLNLARAAKKPIVVVAEEPNPYDAV